MTPSHSLEIVRSTILGLSPRLLRAPAPRPRRDLPPIPQASSAILGDRSGEAVLVGELVSAVLTHTEEFGDLDERAIGAGVMILGIGLFGLLAASFASLLVEKDLEKEIDPQIAKIGERLERMELLLEKLQPSDQGTDDSQIPESD